jgi:hypothetical protein
MLDWDTRMRTIEVTVTVTPDGTLTAQAPPDVPPGEHLAVLVVDVDGQTTEDWSDLVAAAASGLDFWDNPYDDEDWNDA